MNGTPVPICQIHSFHSYFITVNLCYDCLKDLLTLSNVDGGETVPTSVTTVLSLQNLMDANKFRFLQCYINVCDEVKSASNG